MKSRPTKPRPTSAPRAPSYDDLVQIVDLLRSASQFSEFRLRSGDIELEVRRSNGSAPPPAHVPRLEAAVIRAPDAPDTPAEAVNLPAGLSLVRAPMVGTFYCAPEPGAPPYVEPGTRVAADTVVGIIEVMKLMNTINAGCAGVVTHVLVSNAGAVEYGQPLIAIDPGA